MSTHKPLVWLPACHRNLDLSDPGGYTVLADRYAAAVTALGRYDMLPNYMSSETYTKFAQDTFMREKALIEKLGLAKPN